MKFRINYFQIMHQADNINDLAKRLNTNTRNLDSLMHQVKIHWRGPASEAFVKQCEFLMTEVTATSKRMEAVSDNIKHIAGRIQREDEAAAERAKRLAQKTKG